jgi:hypothetical protein
MTTPAHANYGWWLWARAVAEAPSRAMRIDPTLNGGPYTSEAFFSLSGLGEPDWRSATYPILVTSCPDFCLEL